MSQTGRTTTFSPPGSQPTGTTIPVSGVGGWSAAGNYGVPPSPTGPTAGLNVNGVFIQGERGNFNIGGAGGVQGVRYPVGASYQIPWGTVAPVAAGIVCALATAGVCGVASGVAAAAPYIMNWIDRAGLKRDPETGAIERSEIDPSWPVSDGYLWHTVWQPSGSGNQYFESAVGACRGMAPLWSAAHSVPMTNIRVSGSTCLGATGGNPDYPFTAVSRGNASECPAGWYITPFGCFSAANLPRVVQTVDQVIEALKKVNPDPRVWGETLERGGEIPMPNPTVTGPSQIQGPETVKQNQDGSREVSRTTYNFTTNGNQVTNTSNVTTTNIFNSSNVQTSTTTTATTPSDTTPGAEQEEEDMCAKHPEILGCQKIDFDTPDGEIPKKDKQVTYAPESVLTGGSCPAPRELAYGRSFSYAATCDALTTYVRPMVIAIAGWIAIVIIFGVGRPE
ncbi:hypothetical protein GmRootV118_22920 [Variovorax sp. V118]